MQLPNRDSSQAQAQCGSGRRARGVHPPLPGTAGGPGSGRPASSSTWRLPRVSEPFSLWHLPLPSSRRRLGAAGAQCCRLREPPANASSGGEPTSGISSSSSSEDTSSCVHCSGRGERGDQSPRYPRTQPGTCSPEPPGPEAECPPVTPPASPPAGSEWTWQPGNDFTTSPLLSSYHVPKNKREGKWLSPTSRIPD